MISSKVLLSLSSYFAVVIIIIIMIIIIIIISLELYKRLRDNHLMIFPSNSKKDIVDDGNTNINTNINTNANANTNVELSLFSYDNYYQIEAWKLISDAMSTSISSKYNLTNPDDLTSMRYPHHYLYHYHYNNHYISDLVKNEILEEYRSLKSPNHYNRLKQIFDFKLQKYKFQSAV